MIQALVDPNEKTNKALVAILDVSFIHYIDAPSLALLVPILERGLKERSTDVKRRAAQIVGNMASLTDQRDFIPYLVNLLPLLREVLVDPVPEARATSAKALGLMVERMGETSFPGLISELFNIIKSDVAGVDVTGASQGLSEIIFGLGLERLEELLPAIISNLSSSKTYVRKGFMTLLIYLPTTHGAKFEPYLSQIITPILNGIADDFDLVRDTAIKAASIIVKNYSSSAIKLMLPELEKGVVDKYWRIRLSSLNLLGELLFKIGKIASVSDADDEVESSNSESSKKLLVEALGIDHYQKLLCVIYILMSDSHGVVRQAALKIWRSLVSNTPKTVKELLPILISDVVTFLAEDSTEQMSTAARCLAELVKKFGDGILDIIFPILSNLALSDSSSSRKGVCFAISEILNAAGKTIATVFSLQCVPLIRDSLIDEERKVREVAALAFDVLHQNLGGKVIDIILPSLVSQLQLSSESTKQIYALEALKEIMSVRSNIVFPVIIPILLCKPLTSFNIRALGTLISVAGVSINRRLSVVLNSLIDSLYNDKELTLDIKNTLNILAVEVAEDGMSLIMSDLADLITAGGKKQKIACEMVDVIFRENQSLNLDEYIGEWISRLLLLFKLEDPDSISTAWKALDSVIRRIEKPELERFAILTRRAISAATEDLASGETLSGFNLPKGITSCMLIFNQSLTTGSTDNRAQGAMGLGDLVKWTAPESLFPSITGIAGPLIRIIGDRFPSSIKSAILQTIKYFLF